MIRFDAVRKEFPDGTVAVDDLDLLAESGRITVFVGPSGCGKTTSLRMVNRMVESTSGRILVDDVDTATLEPADLRRGMGYVIQHGGLFPHRTVAANIGTVPGLLGWDRARIRARSAELLDLVGLEPSLGSRYPHQLSGGQQQRVGVARALAADPPVLLMDEPFSAVDPVVRSELQDEFLRLQNDLGKTIILVTHDIDEAVKLGDRIAVFATGGRLAQFADPATLLSRPADGTVAELLGRDRGYRSLGFRAAGELPLRDETTLQLGSEQAGTGHVLVVDEHRRPLGWTRPDRGAGPVGREHLELGGTLAPAEGSLRAVLDAALSSPSGRGVVVDEDGVLLGTITVEDASRLVADRLRDGGPGRGDREDGAS